MKRRRIALHPVHSTRLLHCTVLSKLHHPYSTALHYTTTTLLQGAVLYNALHQHCMTLHFTAWCSAMRCTVFYCTSSALNFTALYTMHLTNALYFTALHQHCISLHSAVVHIRLYFTERCSALRCTVFFNPSEGTALYYLSPLQFASSSLTLPHCTVQCTSLYCTQL